MDGFARIFSWLARPEQKWALSKFTYGIGRPGEVGLALNIWQPLVGEKLELVYDPLTMALWVDFGAQRTEVLLIDTKLYLSYAWYTDFRLYIVRVNVFGGIENRMRLHFQSIADREAFVAAMPTCFSDRCMHDPKAPPPSGATVVDVSNYERAQGSTGVALATEAATAGTSDDGQRQATATATPLVTEQNVTAGAAQPMLSYQEKAVKARKRRGSDDEWAADDGSESEDYTEYESDEEDFQKENSADSLSEAENDDEQPSSSQWYNKGPRPKKRRAERQRKQTTVDILQLAMGEIGDEILIEEEGLPVSVPCVPNTNDVLSKPIHPQESNHLSPALSSEPTLVLPPPTSDDVAVTDDISLPLINTIEAAEAPPQEDNLGTPPKHAPSITASPAKSTATASEAPVVTPRPAKSTSTASEPSTPIAARTRGRFVARPGPSKNAPPVTPSPAKSTSTTSEQSTPIAARTRDHSVARPDPTKNAPPVTPSPAKSTSTASEPSTPIAERTRRRSARAAVSSLKTMTQSKRSTTPAKSLQLKAQPTPPKTPTTPKEPIMTRQKALQLGVVIEFVKKEDKAKTRKALSKEDQLATEADEAAAAAASLNMATDLWAVDEDVEGHQYHAYVPMDHDMAVHGLAGFDHAKLSDSGFVAEDDFEAVENVALAPVPWNNDAPYEEHIEGFPSVDARLDQNNSVKATTLETPAVEPLVDESAIVSDADQQPTTSKASTRGSKKKAAAKAATVKNAKKVVKCKVIRKKGFVGESIGARLRAGRSYNLRNKKELQRSARRSF